MNADERGYPWESVVFLLCIGHGNDLLFDIANSTLGWIICVHLRSSAVFRIPSRERLRKKEQKSPVFQRPISTATPIF